MAGQVQAAAVQHLPPLNTFTSEVIKVKEKTFDKWLELFEEISKLASWSPAQQLLQLKVLLNRTVLRSSMHYLKLIMMTMAELILLYADVSY